MPGDIPGPGEGTPAGTIFGYELFDPQYSMNASGTMINVRVPKFYRVFAGVGETPYPGPSLYPGFSWWMKASNRDDWFGQPGDTYEQDGKLTELWGGDEDLVTLGYAVVSDAVAASRIASGRLQLWQSDFTAFVTVPIRQSTAVTDPFSGDYVSFSFATPQSPSRLYIAMKFPNAQPQPPVYGGSGAELFFFEDPNIWYHHMVEGPMVDGVPGPPPMLDPIVNYGGLETWHVPAVSISLNPPGVRTGESATVTVQAPESLGTLTASSFVVVGGTLTNFSQST